MSMKPWERKIIEYRPNIGLKRTILTTIIKRAGGEDNSSIYKPTAKLIARTDRLAIDVIESIIATLSKLNDMKASIEQTLAYDPTFIKYKEAVDTGDQLLADEIHQDNMVDIIGRSELDVYPIIVDFIDELIEYLDTVNDTLFDGKVDYADLEPSRKEEEEKMESMLQMESEQLSLQTRPVFTPQQLILIDRLVRDPDEEINSVEDYIQALYTELRNKGATGIDYEDIADESRTIYSFGEKADMFRGTSDSIAEYLYSSLDSFVAKDIQGSLEFLSDTTTSLHDIMESLGTSYQYYASKTLNSYLNTKRIADRGIREVLDKQLVQVQAKKSRLVDTLLRSMQTNNESGGAISFRDGIREGVGAADNMWAFILTEHIGTTEMNDSQYSELHSVLMKKKQHQLLFKYTDIVSREFDFDHRERELQTFAHTHSLHSLR